MHGRSVSALLFGLCLMVFATGAAPTNDSLTTVRDRLEKKQAVLVDVREMPEWKERHLRDAKLVPLSELRKAAKDPAVREALTKDLAKNRIVYCHCAKGIRAISAGGLLEMWGFDVRPLGVSYEELVKAGFVETGK